MMICITLAVAASCPLVKEKVFSTSRMVVAKEALCRPDDVERVPRVGALLLTNGANS